MSNCCRARPPSTSRRVSIISPAQLAAYLACSKGLFILSYAHDDDCPRATNGTGRGCLCTPDVYLVDASDNLILGQVK